MKTTHTYKTKEERKVSVIALQNLGGQVIIPKMPLVEKVYQFYPQPPFYKFTPLLSRQQLRIQYQ